VDKEKYTKKLIQDLGPYINLGWQMVVTILLMVFIGHYIDKLAQTKPLFTIIFALLGCAAALFDFIRSTLRKRS
jgi:F0F1-type ATP synthase assembly protein I